MAKQVRPRKREPGSYLSFEDVSQIRTFPADSIGASRPIILHQRPDIRQQPDLNMPDIKIILHTWRHPYKVSLRGGIVLPSARVFHGGLRVHNENPFKVEYQLFGDPAWRDLLGIPPSRRVFIYVRIPGHRGHPFRLIVGSDSE